MVKAAPIPIIDLDGQDQARIARELVDAAAEYGFVYIKSSDEVIPSVQVDKAFAISKTLFQSPLEEKNRCKIGKNNRGWSGMHTETLDPKTQQIGDFKEAFNFGIFVDGKATQPIPKSIEPYQADLATFRGSCDALCSKLLYLFGVGLGTNPPEFFAAAHPLAELSPSTMRFLYYPPPSATPSAQDADLRAGAHSDYGSVTLLFRLKGQAGLEIQTLKDGWAPVPVCPPGTEQDPSPPILVNIGDLLSYWTNGLLRSTVHRVTFASPGASNNAHSAGLTEGESTTDPRYSIAYFCHPADKTTLGAVPSERVRDFRGELATSNAGNPYAERQVITAAEHLQMRLQATYLQLYPKDDSGEDLVKE